MKKCKECGAEKQKKDFYGDQGECKDCTRLRVRLREQRLRKNPEWVEKEKIRAREKYHRLDYKNKHKPTDWKKHYREVTKKEREKYPEKYRAKNASQKLRPNGLANQLHHWSYNKPHWADCIELSVLDHAKLHRYMTYDQERMMYRTLEGILLDTREKHIEYFNSLKNKD